MGFALALLIVVVNALVVSRGETVLARLGEWPLLGQVDVTAEAIAEGAVVRPARRGRDGRLRRLLGLRRPRPGAARAAAARRPLGADRDPGLAPGPRRRRRRRPPARRRPAARPRRRRRSARAALARRLLAGSLDRAVDVAATLELRGYASTRPAAGRDAALAPARGVRASTAASTPSAAARARRRDRRQAARRRRLPTPTRRSRSAPARATLAARRSSSLPQRPRRPRRRRV